MTLNNGEQQPNAGFLPEPDIKLCRPRRLGYGQQSWFKKKNFRGRVNFVPHCQFFISDWGGDFGWSEEISKLQQLALFIPIWLFGLRDCVAAWLREIAPMAPIFWNRKSFGFFSKKTITTQISALLCLSLHLIKIDVLVALSGTGNWEEFFVKKGARKLLNSLQSETLIRQAKISGCGFFVKACESRWKAAKLKVNLLDREITFAKCLSWRIPFR